MADYDDEPDYDEDSGNTVTLNRKQIRVLEQKAKQADELASKLAGYEKTATFTDAGFNLSDPEHQLFFRDYDGEVTVDSIRAAATAKGWEFGEVDQTSGDYDLDGATVGSGGSMRDDLEEVLDAATSQDDLNERISNVYRAHGETVATDL
jgi:hypothetical protein